MAKTCKGDQKILCGKSNCTVCFGRSIAGYKIFRDFELDNGNPMKIKANSTKEYIFTCRRCGWEIYRTPCKIFMGSGCPHCGGEKLCGSEDCDICEKYSFMISEKVEEWDYKKNRVKPWEIFSGDKRIYYFVACSGCGHEVRQSPWNIVEKGEYCDHCEKGRICASSRRCKICPSKVFGSHKNSEYWHKEKNKGINVWEVLRESSEEYWFYCRKCDHVFQREVKKMCSNIPCRFCVGKDVCECAECEENSFSICENSKYAVDSIEGIGIRSGRTIGFACEKGHIFRMRACDVADGNWCRECNKGLLGKAKGIMRLVGRMVMG
jgi:hypothetical protein